jgi:NADPH-dependent 2,4-dienoyl-CoA reductase/sulfur reductase-like enzyme
LRLGTSALGIDREARTIDLSDGEALSYDKLLLTTGARVRRLSSPGSDYPAYTTSATFPTPSRSAPILLKAPVWSSLVAATSGSRPRRRRPAAAAM